MKTRSRWTIIIVTALSIFTAAAIYDDVMRGKLQDEYGATPGIGIWHSSPYSGSYCHSVTSVGSPAHYDLFGNTWQEPPMKWEQVRLSAGYNGDVPIPHKGVIRIGDQICDLNERSPYIYVHLPTGKRMWTENWEKHRPLPPP